MSNVHPLPVKARENDGFDAPPPPPYAEFAVSTNFSFLRAASHPEELVEQAKALGLSAIGIADRNSVAGVVRAHVMPRKRACGLPSGHGWSLPTARPTSSPILRTVPPGHG